MGHWRFCFFKATCCGNKKTNGKTEKIDKYCFVSLFVRKLDTGPETAHSGIEGEKKTKQELLDLVTDITEEQVRNEKNNNCKHRL